MKTCLLAVSDIKTETGAKTYREMAKCRPQFCCFNSQWFSYDKQRIHDHANNVYTEIIELTSLPETNLSIARQLLASEAQNTERQQRTKNKITYTDVITDGVCDVGWMSARLVSADSDK